MAETKMKMERTQKKRERLVPGRGLLDLVFSWSLHDLLNQHLFKNQVKSIPHTFTSVADYFNSFVPPLVSETHADLSEKFITISQAPLRQLFRVETKKGFNNPNNLIYNVTCKSLVNVNHEYEPLIGDVILLTNIVPKCIDDLIKPNATYTIAYVLGFCENYPNMSPILSSKPLFDENDGPIYKPKALLAVFLTNMLTNLRVWKALHPDPKGGNLNIIKRVLQPHSTSGEDCSICSAQEKHSSSIVEVQNMIDRSFVNDSQQLAIQSCFSLKGCRHQNSVKLIWGPPGTGKTNTVGVLLSILLRSKCRTLTCAPTNIAVLQVAARLLKLVTGSLEIGTCGLGDIVLFGNAKRMKVDDHPDLTDIFLDNRANLLLDCLDPLTGWRHNLSSMVHFLENPEMFYNQYRRARQENHDGEVGDNVDVINVVNARKKGVTCGRKSLKYAIVEVVGKNKALKKVQGNSEKEAPTTSNDDEFSDCVSFVEFAKKRFRLLADKLKSSFEILFTHLPTSVISIKVVKEMVSAIGFINSTESLMLQDIVSEEDELEYFESGNVVGCLSKLCYRRNDLVVLLKSISKSFWLPHFEKEYQVKNYCLANALLLFCTASGSSKLHNVRMVHPLELVVIDEAAQLKECESAIPLQLPGIRHAILIGDECQLPAMVQSKVSDEASFGRSLFERLVLLGHKKHLLDIQYRMHPSISLFPNQEFYDGKIFDGPNVKEMCYEKRFLLGQMYSSYSFINIAQGKEDGLLSKRNMVEVAVVFQILGNLHKEFVQKKVKISIGVISPYTSQVLAIQKRIGKTYKEKSDFSVSVRSVDGFQGGEMDVIIISTVRSNGSGSVGFLSNLNRANVALTRARYCLWILGNDSTLSNSDSIWKKIVNDAKERGCFYDAHKDRNLTHAMTTALVQHGQVDASLSLCSPLFQDGVWKIIFSDGFRKSLARVKCTTVRKNVILVLMKLSGGWRQSCKTKNVVDLDGTSSQLLEQYKINKKLILLWSVNLVQENSSYVQVVMVWDVLPPSSIQVLAQQLDAEFDNFTVDKMNRCKIKCLEGSSVVPKRFGLERQYANAGDLSKSFSKLSLGGRALTQSSSMFYRPVGTKAVHSDTITPKREPERMTTGTKKELKAARKEKRDKKNGNQVNQQQSSGLEKPDATPKREPARTTTETKKELKATRKEKRDKKNGNQVNQHHSSGLKKPDAKDC